MSISMDWVIRLGREVERARRISSKAEPMAATASPPMPTLTRMGSDPGSAAAATEACGLSVASVAVAVVGWESDGGAADGGFAAAEMELDSLVCG